MKHLKWLAVIVVIWSGSVNAQEGISLNGVKSAVIYYSQLSTSKNECIFPANDFKTSVSFPISNSKLRVGDKVRQQVAIEVEVFSFAQEFGSVIRSCKGYMFSPGLILLGNADDVNTVTF